MQDLLNKNKNIFFLKIPQTFIKKINHNQLEEHHEIKRI